MIRAMTESRGWGHPPSCFVVVAVVVVAVVVRRTAAIGGVSNMLLSSVTVSIACTSTSLEAPDQKRRREMYRD